MLIKVIYSLTMKAAFSRAPDSHSRLAGWEDLPTALPSWAPHQYFMQLGINICPRLLSGSYVERRRQERKHLPTNSAKKSRSASANTDQRSAQRATSRCAAQITSSHRCVLAQQVFVFSRNKMSDSLQDRGHYLVWKRIPPPPHLCSLAGSSQCCFSLW